MHATPRVKPVFTAPKATKASTSNTAIPAIPPNRAEKRKLARQKKIEEDPLSKDLSAMQKSLSSMISEMQKEDNQPPKDDTQIFMDYATTELRKLPEWKRIKIRCDINQAIASAHFCNDADAYTVGATNTINNVSNYATFPTNTFDTINDNL